VELPILWGCDGGRTSQAVFLKTSICHTVASLFTQTGDSNGRNGVICSNLIVLIGYKRTAKPAGIGIALLNLPTPSQFRILPIHCMILLDLPSFLSLEDC